MNRKYFFPVMALFLAAVVYYFSDKSQNKNQDINEMKKNSSATAKELSIAPDPSTVGALTIQMQYADGKTPDTINGSLDLIKINSDGTEQSYQSYQITESSLKCEFLLPGKYRIKAAIKLTGAEFVSDTDVIDIFAAKTSTHIIVISK
jgi:hypothetical protein